MVQIKLTLLKIARVNLVISCEIIRDCKYVNYQRHTKTKLTSLFVSDLSTGI